MTRFQPCRALIPALAAGLVGLLAATPADARDWRVPTEAATIQAAVDSAVSGDVIVLAPGVYDDCSEINGNGVAHIAILRNGIHLRGETGDPADVVLDAGRLGRCLELRSLADTTRITAVTFRRGKASDPFGSGGAVFAFAAHPVFESCVFDSCEADFAGGGVSVGSGSVALRNCVLIDCATGNIGAAVRATASDLEITGTTVFRSRGAAVHYAGEQPTVVRTIIAGGDGAAMARNNAADPVPLVRCTDIWGNGSDWSDFLAGLAGADGNLSVDPLFCNPLFGDLHLYATSPCAPDGADCGLIGGLPVGCGAGTTVRRVRPDGGGDYATIQDALNAAVDADTVALEAGVYTGAGNRDLDFLGKGVVVRGPDGDASAAVIDCGGSALEPHRGVLFLRGETGFAVLRDLTIRNADVDGDGAAVLAVASSPRIENVVFTANHAERGAALFARGGAPAIRDCEVFGNEGRAFAGGFAFHASDATIDGCLFRNNWGQRASALFLPDSSAVTVTRTTFDGNASAGDRAAIELEGSSHLDLANCQITNGNRAALHVFDTATASAVRTNVHGNAEGNWVDGLAGQGYDSGNLSVDPLYCDRPAFDFHLRGDSPCASWNAGNGEPMGRDDAGCDAPAHFALAAGGAPAAGTAAVGVTWTDLDGDGALDLHVFRPEGPDLLLRGDGAGVLADLADPVAAAITGAGAATWADRDGDGDQDVYWGRPGDWDLTAAWQGAGLGIVTPDGLPDSAGAAAAVWCDQDADGDPDLLLVRPDSTVALLRRRNDGGFSDETASTGLVWRAPWTDAVWVDYDRDGRQDLYLLADGAENRLLHNLATGFAAVAASAIQDAGRTRSAAWADYSNDGRPDLLLVDDGAPTRILRQVGTGTFTAVTAGALYGNPPGRSGLWGDWDNDGDLDVFLTRCGARDQLLRNDGSDRFLDVGEPAFAGPDSSTGAAFGDYDGDGRLDLAVADRSGAVRVFRNTTTNGNHWLQVRPVGETGAAAPPGTRVWIRTPDGPDQVRELGAGGGWRSRDAMTAHFGLAANTVVDSLRVVWPDGRVRIRTAVAVDRMLVVAAPGPSAVPGEDGPGDVPAVRAGLGRPAPNPFNPATRIRFGTAGGGRVDLRVYDVAGRLVATLIAGDLAAGPHEILWRGRDDAGRTVAAGVYLVRLDAGGRAWTRPVTLVK